MTLERKNIQRKANLFTSVSKLEKALINFVIPVATINSFYYCNEVLSQLPPEIEQLPNVYYLFQEHGAHSHTSKVTLAYLEKHCCKVLKPDFCPSRSPDLNLVIMLYLGHTGSQNLEA